ncbi:metalloregulator ArsR/SmtB family transcription factor [Sinorhizobium garamanticum]|uniref:Metalloregulator ArsR/SmtB family transcription factor n=1 Tax=Sinorhizobium garamanticum TaxID=680247 RepID=A0ABY8D8D1_9HYPH|nr:metalloregulator ArsR/SmtB family transcription factor [Sinorhizobium garamanticum]WEX86307.1 metalloregulator ArsR/SmtB family transcription factor [Sinorhizobium garamanticum]
MARLAHGEASVSELAAPFDMSLPAVSKHLVVLEKAGLLRRRIDGRVHYCSLSPEALEDASDWIAFYQQFWKQRLNSLAKWLAKEEGATEPNDPEETT